MRTTIRLDDELLAQAKTLAARTGRSLTGLIEDALRLMLERRDSRRNEEPPFAMPTASGKGVKPGIDLDDSAGLWDATAKRATR